MRIKRTCLCCLLLLAGAGFAMGSRSATTSPTGSIHSTPTHQTKPNTLDPFADIGNLGGSFGGLSLAIQKVIPAIVSPLPAKCGASLGQVRASPANPPHRLDLRPSCRPWAPRRGLLRLPSTELSRRGNPALRQGRRGSHKDKAPPRSQSPAPVMAQCRTRRPRTDQTTTSASLLWVGARPVQRARPKPAWVSRWWRVESG